MSLSKEDFMCCGSCLINACPEESPSLKLRNYELDDILQRAGTDDVGEVEAVYARYPSPSLSSSMTVFGLMTIIGLLKLWDHGQLCSAIVSGNQRSHHASQE